MARSTTIANASGFSLIETLIGATVTVSGVIGLAGLFVAGTMGNHNARKSTYATVFAQQKIEQLRALTYSFDSLGLGITDTTTNTAVVPPDNQGSGLAPGGSLGANIDGYVDYLDAKGNSLGGGTQVPAAAMYIRRWMIQPHPNNPTNTIVLQVLVTTSRNRGTADSGTVARLPNEARFLAVKTRKFQ